MSTTRFDGTLYLGTVTVDLSHVDISASYAQLDIDVPQVGTAHAQIKGLETLDLSGVFWFKTDSLDVSNNDEASNPITDFKVAYNKTLFDYRISLALQGLEAKASELTVLRTPTISEAGQHCDSICFDATNSATSGPKGTDPWTQDLHDRFGNMGTRTIGNNGAHFNALPNGDADYNDGSNNALLGKDIARFIAFKLTGGYPGTDIFSNESELLERINHYIDISNSSVGSGLYENIENNFVPAPAITYNDELRWGDGTSSPPSDNSGVLVGDSSDNFTEVIIDYFRRSINGDVNDHDIDLGQYLIRQASHYGSITDASGDNAASIPWTPLTMDASAGDINVVIKVVFTHIAEGTHNGNQTVGNGGVAGGNNIVGSRSYLISLTNSDSSVRSTLDHTISAPYSNNSAPPAS